MMTCSQPVRRHDHHHHSAMLLCRYYDALVILLLLSGSGSVAAGEDLCRRLGEMNGVNEDFMSAMGYGFISDHEYFCGPDAPTQFACSCGAAGVCVERRDPWGRDVGECGCCPAWVWIILGCFCVLLLASVFMIFYACCLRGKWWFDGFPEPIQPLLPRRGPPAVVPAGMPLPQNLFRGYRITDFSSELPPEPTNETASAVSGRGGSDASAVITSQTLQGRRTSPTSSSTIRNRAPSAITTPTSGGNQRGASSPPSLHVVPPPQQQMGGANNTNDALSSSPQHRRHHHNSSHQPVTSSESSRVNSNSSTSHVGPTAEPPNSISDTHNGGSNDVDDDDDLDDDDVLPPPAATIPSQRQYTPATTTQGDAATNLRPRPMGQRRSDVTTAGGQASIDLSLL
jgi:hypothetical protein